MRLHFGTRLGAGPVAPTPCEIDAACRAHGASSAKLLSASESAAGTVLVTGALGLGHFGTLADTRESSVVA